MNTKFFSKVIYQFYDKLEECDLCTTTQQCSPPTHSFMHNCKVMRQNHNQNLEPDLYPRCSLFLPTHTNTHFTLCKTAIPKWKKPTTFPGTQCGFILMIKEKTRHPQKKRRLTLSFFHYLVWSWSRRAGTRPDPGRLWLAASSSQSPGADGACGSKWRQPRVPGQWGAVQDSLEAPDQPGRKKGTGKIIFILHGSFLVNLEC